MLPKAFSALALAVAGALIVTGCAKSGTTSTASTTAATAVGPVAGDAAHGKQIFAANCSSCHGATGIEGGVGPSLANEKARKNDGQTIAWIKNPQPPMPKLYPAPLSDSDVADVAAYVQSL